ncbi:PREDICTED: uncharacterized protein LOC101303026 [Fragaria vesca subsp. vesca]
MSIVIPLRVSTPLKLKNTSYLQHGSEGGGYAQGIWELEAIGNHQIKTRGNQEQEIKNCKNKVSQVLAEKPHSLLPSKASTFHCSQPKSQNPSKLKVFTLQCSSASANAVSVFSEVDL